MTDPITHREPLNRRNDEAHPSSSNSLRSQARRALRSGLSRRQKDDIESFMHAFSDVELALKGRMRLAGNDRTPISRLIDQYESVNPYWVESAQRLRTLAEIRNLLAHQRGQVRGFPIAITSESLEDIRQILVHLQEPEPASRRFRKTVDCVSPADPLSLVLIKAFERGFSQFPVIEDSAFRGLITENEIARWFGRAAKSSRTIIDLNAVSVRSVLRERDPAFRDIPIFCFAASDDPVEEIVGKFTREPALEVVLFTKNGRKDTPIEGIVTQWDAARFRG